MSGAAGLAEFETTSQIPAANNPAVRPHYLKTLEGIPGKLDGSLPIRDQALQAFQLRNAAVAESVR
jgi:hypothetical protein